MRCREEIDTDRITSSVSYAIGIIEEIYRQHSFHCVVVGMNGGNSIRLRARNLGTWQPIIFRIIQERLEWQGFELKDMGGCFEIFYHPKENQTWVHRTLT